MNPTYSHNMSVQVAHVMIVGIYLVWSISSKR